MMIRDHRRFWFFIGMTKAKKKTQRRWLCAIVFMFERSENKEEVKMMTIYVIIVLFYFSQE